MTDKSTLIGFGGVALVGAQFWLSGQRTAFTGGVLTKDADTAAKQAAHTTLTQVAGELLLVAVAALGAGQSDQVGTIALVVLIALWFMWIMNHYRGGKWVATQ